MTDEELYPRRVVYVGHPTKPTQRLRNWWHRHPRWRMFWWGFCNPLSLPRPWWSLQRQEPYLRPLTDKFNHEYLLARCHLEEKPR